MLLVLVITFTYNVRDPLHYFLQRTVIHIVTKKVKEEEFAGWKVLQEDMTHLLLSPLRVTLCFLEFLFSLIFLSLFLFYLLVVLIKRLLFLTYAIIWHQKHSD